VIKKVENTMQRVDQNKEPEPSEAGHHRKALIIGGGVAGIRAALDVARAGFTVVLVENKPAIGGHMAQLAQVFPKMELGSDILIPLMNEVGHHPNIKLLTLSEVTGIEGCLGNFHISIKKNPRRVNPDKCDLCNERGGAQCIEVCPITVPSEFDEGLILRKAIYIPFPQAVPNTYTIDGDVCITCGKCAQPDVCASRAVNLADEEEIIEEDVGVVIVATGYELCSRESLGKSGVNECPDVITSLQFERLLSPSGPTAGEPKRLSDKKVPERIAFIHCAGSLCSQMSRAYLAKQAILFKKLVPHGEVYFLHGDVDTKGMNYEYLMKKAQEEAKVNYIQTEVSRIYEQDGKVKILGVKSQRGESTEIEVDMAVVALPMMSSLEVDEHGFPREMIPKLRLVESATPGILLVGSTRTPMDVQSTVAQAGEAASKVLEILTQMKHTRKE